MAGQGRIYVTATREVGDIKTTHQYDVDLRFDIGFDYGGYNNNARPWSMSCDGQSKSGSTTFNVPSGNGTYQWTNIGGTQTFRITMPTSGQAKTIGFSATISTNVNPPTISASGSHTLAAVTWTTTKATYTVSYDANQGSNAPPPQTAEVGTSITISSTTPTRKGYTFKGWGTSKSTTTVSYSAGGTYSGNATIKLYAIWSITDTNIYIYPAIKQVECVEFIEDGKSLGFYSGGKIHATEFIESSDNVYFNGTKFVATELCER